MSDYVFRYSAASIVGAPPNGMGDGREERAAVQCARERGTKSKLCVIFVM